MPRFTAIVAASDNDIIGIRDAARPAGDLPWRLPDDLRFFQATTLGQPVVMGRNCYLSIPSKFRPLPNRRNLVLSHEPQDPELAAAEVFGSKEVLLANLASWDGEVFIAGGAMIYELFRAETTRLLLTRVATSIQAEPGQSLITLPNYGLESGWELISRRPHAADEKHNFAFEWLEYRRR